MAQDLAGTGALARANTLVICTEYNIQAQCMTAELGSIRGTPLEFKLYVHKPDKQDMLTDVGNKDSIKRRYTSDLKSSSIGVLGLF